MLLLSDNFGSYTNDKNGLTNRKSADGLYGHASRKIHSSSNPPLSSRR